MLRLFIAYVILSFLLFSPQIAAADIDIHSLEHELKALILKPDETVVLATVRSHRSTLVQNPVLASLAVIALRRSGYHDVALALAERTLRVSGYHRRLGFEHAVTAWAIGDCPKATTLFAPLVEDDPDDLVGRESRLFMASCQAMEHWRYEWVSSFGYSENLGGTRAQRNIRTEPGSVYHTLLTSLDPFINLPKTISLGQKPVGGFWAAIHPGVIRHRHHPAGVDLLRLGADFRLANRRGHEQWRGRADLIRQRRYGAVSQRLGMKLYYGRANLGQNRPHRMTSGITTDYRLSYTLPRHLAISAGVVGTYQESDSLRRSRIQSQDLRVGLSHQGSRNGGLAGLGWNIYLQKGVDAASPHYQSGKRNRIGAGIGPFYLDDKTTLSAEISHERKAYTIARPWLAAPHQDKTLTAGIGVTYPIGKGKSLTFRFSHVDVRSPDPLDHASKWQISFLFRH